MALLTTLKKFMRTKLGSLFLSIIAVGLTFTMMNSFMGTSSVSRSSAVKSNLNVGQVGELGQGKFRWEQLKTLKGVKPVGKGWDVFLSKEKSKQYCKVAKLDLKHDANSEAFETLQPLNCKAGVPGYHRIFQLQGGIVKVVSKYKSDLNKFQQCVFNKITRIGDAQFSEETVQTQHASSFKEFRFRGDFLYVSCYDEIVDSAVTSHRRLLSLSGGHLSGRRRVLEDGSEDPDPTGDDAGEKHGDEEEDQTGYGGTPDTYDYGPSVAPAYEQFLVQVDPRRDAVKRQDDTIVAHDGLGLNIAIIGLDSLSHLSVQRKLPKLYYYLREKLGAYIMSGFNIVGDATAPMFLAMLTGQYQKELPEIRKHVSAEKFFLDNLPWIWNRYEQSGYVTMYAEDEPTLTAFNLRFNGFDDEPTDHYMRHFWQAAWASDLNKGSTRFCVGDRQKLAYHLDYLEEFYLKYPKLRKFSFLWHGELTHADNNPGQYADAPLVELLEAWERDNVLNQTALIFVTDHGARYRKVRQSLQGKLEERLPFLAVVLPEWVTKKYPRVAANLKANRERLVTAFDVHATLLDLLSWDYERITQPPRRDRRDVSLFSEVPLNRTCESAGIDLHWCSCLTWQEANPQDDRVKAAAKEMITQINLLTEPSRKLCQKISLTKIMDAKVVLPNEQVLRFYNSLDSDQLVANISAAIKGVDIVYYQITMETSPFAAIFEATVQVKVYNSDYQVMEGISRLDEYRDKSHCIMETNVELRQFCACANPKT